MGELSHLTALSMRGQKVLVTGGLGFIGSNLARCCLELGAEVTVYDCLDPRSGGNMYNLRGVEDDVEIVLNDIRNFEGVSESVRNKDILFSCAAYTSHPHSMKEPLIDIDVNCKGVINLLEATRRFRPELKFVHVGTSTQIGRMHFSPADENHPEFPVDIYSANKSASEKYVLIYGGAYRMRTAVVRLANVYGPRSNIRSADFGFVNYLIGLALRGKDLPVFGEGRQLRNISYVDDCVSALILASQHERSEGQVFFAGAAEQLSVAEMAGAIARVIGGRVTFVEWQKEREVIEIGDAVISSEKIKRILDWSPRHDIADGLARTREYYVSCVERYLG